MAALALGIFLILGSNACTSEPVSCRPLASSVLAASASLGGFSAATSSPIRFCVAPNTVSTLTSWGTLVAWKPFSTACWAALDSLPTVLRCALYSLADRRPLPPHADTSRTTIAAVHETRTTHDYSPLSLKRAAFRGAVRGTFATLAQPSVSEPGSRRPPVVPGGETEPGGAQPVSEGGPPGPGIPP